MKTILVPTDFSDNARNAIDYAINVAKLTNAQLILLHIFHVPIASAEAPIVIPLDEIEKDCSENLKNIEKNIVLIHGSTLNIECICRCGFLVDEVEQITQERNIDLIIMGMHGSGYLSERLIGSNTTSLMQKLKCPILAIHQSTKFKSIKKIALACDYQSVDDLSILNPLKEFVKLFESRVYVLNVIPNLETVPSFKEAVAGVRIEDSLEGIDYSFHSVVNEDVIDGINNFVDDHKIDMLAMIPHKHSIFKSIFHRSNTKRMTFHSHIPVLSLHE